MTSQNPQDKEGLIREAQNGYSIAVMKNIIGLCIGGSILVSVSRSNLDKLDAQYKRETSKESVKNYLEIKNLRDNLESYKGFMDSAQNKLSEYDFSSFQQLTNSQSTLERKLNAEIKMKENSLEIQSWKASIDQYHLDLSYHMLGNASVLALMGIIGILNIGKAQRDKRKQIDKIRQL